MTNEKWLPIPEWEDAYEVSNLGKIKRIAPVNNKPSGWIMKNTAMNNGYFKVRLRYKGKSAQPLVRSLVMLAFCGPRPHKIHINHIDGKPSNNRLDNLEYVTCSENFIHSYRVLFRQKVSNKGEKGGRHKVSNADVINIRRRFADGGISQQKLADEYGLSQPQVSVIIRRAGWSHI